MSKQEDREEFNAWHTVATDKALEIIDSNENGLDDENIKSRTEKYGKNLLPEIRQRSLLLRFLSHFHNILIYVLLLAAFITALIDHWIDTAVIIAVVLVNATIGFLQEGKAEQALNAIKGMLSLKANVIRNGKRKEVNAEELVPGDIVLLEAGDQVPADIRLLKTYNLSAQEAILTGESTPVEKSTIPVSLNSSIGDRKCMTYSGTMITSGQGSGLIVATGKSTEIGRISNMLAAVDKMATPLTEQMNRFAKWLTFFILLVSSLLLLYSSFNASYTFIEMFMAVVGLAVAAIPEGLPAVLTITLTVGVQRMAKRNAIIRRLPAIETIGSISVICTDKTGTLTLNEMMVSSVATAESIFSITGTGYIPSGDILVEHIKNNNLADLHNLTELGRIAVLCNDSALVEKEDNWSVSGDPMEGALLCFAHKIKIIPEQESNIWKRIDTFPFDPRNRFMATMHHNQDGAALIALKGAPEKIFSMCTWQLSKDGKKENINTARWQQVADDIAANGQRVLAFAKKDIDQELLYLDINHFSNNLVLVGIAGMIDPPREEAISAVAECQRAGISVKMITGDHAATASAIGKIIGLKNCGIVLTGADLDLLSDDELHKQVIHIDIFARTSPENKLRLVEALQKHGLTVAMTGDGVNDAPALKRADAGIAMGKKGSQAAKEAADLVLVDDNFASIAAAIKEGRTVYDNIKKVISWTLPTNAGEASTIILALLFGMTLPITPLQLLWINMITACTLGIALAFEPPEKNSMLRPPRSRNAPLLSGELIWHIIFVSFLFLFGVFGIFFYALNKDYSLDLARTLAMNTIVVMEIFHLFYIRNIYGTSLTIKTIQGTKVIWTTVLLVTAGQFAITYIPPLQKIFSTVNVPIFDGVIVVLIGIALLAIIETEKQVRLRL